MNTTLENSSTNAPTFSPAPLPIPAYLVLIGGLLATWLAAGSLGWISPPLQKVLTWIALGTVLAATAPSRRRLETQHGIMFLAAGVVAVMMTAFSATVVNIMAVVVVLAAIAQVRPGLIGRVAMSVALAATVLALYRMACDASPTVWALSDGLGRAEGHFAAWLTGRPLVIGASFGGIDFLVLMAALTVYWRNATPMNHPNRTLVAVAAIVAAQIVYLLVLAFSDDLTRLLPAAIAPIKTDTSMLGIWSWGNALRTLVPWNLPLLAAILHATIAAVMFGTAGWLPSLDDIRDESRSETEKALRPGSVRKNRGRASDALPSASVRPETAWEMFGPAGLAAVAAFAFFFAPGKPDLQGHKIVAYDGGMDWGGIDWGVNDPGKPLPHDAPRFGLLPVLVESLGGKFVVSKDLAPDDLIEADVVIVLPPRGMGKTRSSAAVPDDVKNRMHAFVLAGGRLLVAGEPESRLGAVENVLNDLLKPTSMAFRDDMANSVSEHWECNLLAAPHAATANLDTATNRFSFDRAASIRAIWPAGPLVSSRWSWDEGGSDPDRPGSLDYQPGNHLGDLVLAAQQDLGRGSIVALGDARCLCNDRIPFSYMFVGRLLGSLAMKSPSPQVWWRQILGLATGIAAIGFLFQRLEVPRLAAVAVLVAAAIVVCTLIDDATARMLPEGTSRVLADGTQTTDRPVAYIDASHLEAMGSDPWCDDGVATLGRVLTHNGYLPLLAPDISADRLNGAGLLFTVAPGKAFSSVEREVIHEFVRAGGYFFNMTGSPDSGPSRQLLQEFDLHIDPMPVPPTEKIREPEPLGRVWRNINSPFGNTANVEFYAAWPVAHGPDATDIWKPDASDKKAVIVGRRDGTGTAVLIGDTCFALNKNFDSTPENAIYWQVLLANLTGRMPPKGDIIEPAEGGIIDVPKSNSDKGVKP